MATGLAIVGALLLIVCGAMLVLAAVLLLQTLAAWPPGQTTEPRAAGRPRLAVLMPAHNEASVIRQALGSVFPQLNPGDRLLVVADNCSDDTAIVAAAAGAEVVERHDPQRRGKGYALEFGVRHFELSPPDTVIIVDADCELSPQCLDHLARVCVHTGRPVQALYLMRAAPGAGLTTRIAEFAWVVKNHARPLGYHRLGMPCQLMGTGMAFPWNQIRAAPLASGHIVEDMQLGLHLAGEGWPPVFCASALVTSAFPIGAEALTAQRTRWEHGHLGLIASHAPRLLWRSLMRGEARTAAMVLDLCVPPLAALLLMSLAVWSLAAVLLAMGGAVLPLALSTFLLAMLCLAVMLAWWRFGRQIVSLRELLAAPAYALAKLPIYAKLLTKRQAEWVRTKRNDERN